MLMSITLKKISNLDSLTSQIQDSTLFEIELNGESYCITAEDLYKYLNSKLSIATTYTNSTPTVTKVGGVEVGTTFDNMSMTEVFDMLFYEYINPSLNMISPPSRILEVGQLYGGEITTSWSVSNDTNLGTTGFKITYLPSDSTLFESSDTSIRSAYINHPNIVRNTISSVGVIQLTTTNSKEAVIKVNNTYTWKHRIYYGQNINSSLNGAEVKLLQKSNLVTSFYGTYSTDEGGYKYIAIPKDMGIATRFRDIATGLLVPFNDPYEVTVVNNFNLSIPYYIYRTVNVLGGSVNIEIY